MKRTALLIVLLLLLLPSVFGLTEYKPYLHKATVPDHPKLALSGTSQIELFTGTEKSKQQEFDDQLLEFY